MEEQYLHNLLLLIILTICLYTDLKKRKVYNKVILAGLALGITLNIHYLGDEGLIFSLKGLALGVALLFLPFAAGGMGAGDVKLLGVVGIIKGAEFVFSAFLFSALAGGMLALIALAVKKRLLSVICSLGGALKLFLWSGFKINPLPTLKSTSSINIPYTPAIVLGTLTAIFLNIA